ncbi:hypothetical protein RJ639_021067 [Escallonia herrerae]|uniref:Uncharacterized protein n=1 Tax=Escallonia herrerae TaxID=1293975 RepID=A0AA89AG45_9ASTE|nr:hypothetical protein RJ639_021067 [Escallonia herrerae]
MPLKGAQRTGQTQQSKDRKCPSQGTSRPTDDHTRQATHSIMARVCVEIEILKPLPSEEDQNKEHEDQGKSHQNDKGENPRKDKAKNFFGRVDKEKSQTSKSKKTGNNAKEVSSFEEEIVLLAEVENQSKEVPKTSDSDGNATKMNTYGYAKNSDANPPMDPSFSADGLSKNDTFVDHHLFFIAILEPKTVGSKIVILARKIKFSHYLECTHTSIDNNFRIDRETINICKKEISVKLGIRTGTKRVPVYDNDHWVGTEPFEVINYAAHAARRMRYLD